MLQRIPAEESLGARGERLAAGFLKKNGYRIVEMNLKLGDDEADVIAVDPDGRTVVIVEVKTRADDGQAPEWSIHQNKQYHLARLASRLAKRKEYRDRPFRFDAIAVMVDANSESEPVIRHHCGAFASPW